MQNDEEISIVMTMDPLHLSAIDKAKSLLSPANVLHADCDFGTIKENNAVLDNCFNPARAGGDLLLNGRSITTFLDTNIVSGFRRILSQEPGAPLDEQSKCIMSLLLLSAACDGQITPGFALIEMHSTPAGCKYLNESFHAFEYLCAQVDFDDVCDCVLNGIVPTWRVPVPEIQEEYCVLDNAMKDAPGSQRYKSELFATISSAFIEKAYGNNLTQDEKLEILIKRIHDKGGFALGSLRYFSLYFSDAPANNGIKRGEMLKSIHSTSKSKAIRGVLNAAADCYFASEYASSLNTHYQRNDPRVFATTDRALQLILDREFKDRSLWAGGISTILANLRGGSMPARAAEILDASIPVFDVGYEPSVRPPLREAAQRFLHRQDDVIAEAWGELFSLLSPT